VKVEKASAATATAAAAGASSFLSFNLRFENCRLAYRPTTPEAAAAAVNTSFGALHPSFFLAALGGEGRTVEECDGERLLEDATLS
jgi:hypothetical protein